LALRAAGAGQRVFFAQFLKGQPTSELAALDRLADLITVRRFGRSEFVTRQPQLGDLEMAQAGLRAARAALATGRFDLIVLDEINVAVLLGLISLDDLLVLVDATPPQTTLVATGRHAPAALIERADLVTEMVEVKHPYRRGVPARVGIEM